MADISIPDWAMETPTSSVPDWAQEPIRRAPLLNQSREIVTPAPVPQFNFKPTSMKQPVDYGTISQTPFWQNLKNQIQVKLENVFPGFREKASPSPQSVIGGAAMVAPLGMPENLGRLLMAYFTYQTAKEQPAIYRQIKQELQTGNYSQAQKDAIGDVLQLGLVGTGIGGMASGFARKPVGETLSKGGVNVPPPPPKPATASPIEARPASMGTSIGDLLAAKGQKLPEAPAEVVPDWAKPATKPAEAATKPQLTPALIVEGKPVTGGATHSDIMRNHLQDANGEAVLDAFADDSKHVFVDQSGKVYNRTEAAKALGKTGKLHSEDLPAAQPNDLTTPLEYSPEDLAKYKELKKRFSELSESAPFSEEHTKVWKEFEALRNKYNGNQPKQIVEANKGTAATPLPEPSPVPPTTGESETVKVPETPTVNVKGSINKPESQLGVSMSAQVSLTPDEQRIEQGRLSAEQDLSDIQKSSTRSQARKSDAAQKALDKVTPPSGGNPKMAENFRKRADAMSKLIENQRRPMTQNPTPKRNREYRSRLHDADNNERVQQAMRVLADAHEKGTLPKILEDVRSRDDVYSLVYKGLEGGGYYDVIPSRDYANKSLKAKTLQQMLETKPMTMEEKATLEERERQQKISQLEEKMRFSNIPGFFPTPKPLATEMASRLNVGPGQSVLEPSAGKGDLADAVKAIEPSSNITTVERMNTLREILKAKGYDVAGDDFMEHSGKYDRIIMNPPFEKGQDIDHVRRAYDQLKPGGKLVALMSEGAFFRSDKKATGFREWLDSVGGTSEKSAEGSFKGVQAFRQTGVASRMVEIDKPAGMVGMGGATHGEVESGSGADIYGIAERVRRERAKSGQVASVPTGEGITAADSIEHGRDMLSAGGNPEKALSDFEKTKAVSADAMALVRAQGEKLSLAARRVEEKFGTTSQEYITAWKALSDWDTRTKPMQTEWHKIGEAQQGFTDIDTGTFTGLQQAYHADTGKEFTPKQAETATKIAKKVQQASNEAEKAQDKVFETAGVKVPETGKILPEVKPEPNKGISTKTPKSTFQDDLRLFGDWKKGSTMTPEQVKALWRRAKAYLDAGENDFDNIRHKLATELGIPVEDVTRGLTQPKGMKQVTDEMYRKMSEKRRLVQSAKTWVKNQQMPGWLRFIRNVPRVFFIDKVFGHGTVGMITHAGMNIFNPTAWRTYWPNFFRQYKLVVSPAYHERMMQDLIRDPLFVKARRAGLANDPFRYTDDYQNAFSNWFHKLGLGGNRGFDSLKLFRQARFNQIWNSLPAQLQTKEYASMVADAINHSTGVVRMPFREWANWTFFAPKLEGSRWAWIVGDPLKAAKTFADWNNATPEAKAFAMSELKQKATIAGVYYALLMANQGLLSASNSKQKINFTEPRRGDFLAFKMADHNLGIVSPLLGMVRLFANLVHASMGKRGKVESLQSRADEFGSTTSSYLRGKLSPFAGFGVDIFSQADFQGRPLPYSSDRVPAYLRRQGIKTPYTYGQYAAQQFTPIPVSEAIKEVWRSQGMNESQMDAYLKALTVAVVAGGTGARLSADTHEKP